MLFGPRPIACSVLFDRTHDMNQSSAPAASEATPTLFQRVMQVVNRIRPAVQSDGGDVELVEVTKEGIARIRLHGACVGCPSSQMTLHMGIERNIREKVPEITGVEQVH
jgi:Fe-S cluster biogenesis protein NfuA